MKSNPNITHRQRLELTLSGNPCDRPPVALWRHFPVDDQSADGLAKTTSLFQKQFDFDFIKITPSSSFCLSDWGVIDIWNGNLEGTRDYTNPVIQTPDDWYKLRPLDPGKGALARQIQCARMLAEEFRPHTPVIQTVFSPLSQAKNLTGKSNLALHLRKYPDAVTFGLQQILETTLRFIEELKRINLDGIFFAVQQAQFNLLSEPEFIKFGKIFDLQIGDFVSDFWLNVLHIHGKEILFETVCDYPFHVINWHDRETWPTIPEGLSRFKGVACGGLSQWETMVKGNPQKVNEEAINALQSADYRRIILGTGCVVPIIAPHGNIAAARAAVEA